MEHVGDGPFVVRLLDDRGALIDTIARATGPFRGSKALHVPRGGTYLYDVRADGAWTIALRPRSGIHPDSSALAGRPDPVPTVAAVPSRVTASALATRAAVDAEQLARRKGAFPWLLGGLAGGSALGPVGAGLVYVAANRSERAPSTEVETRRATYGDAYASAFSSAYEAKRRSDRRVAALIGGATGTVVFGFVVAQIINWSRESGGSSNGGNGELP